MDKPKKFRRTKLTEKDIKILKLLTLDYSDEEIAKTLNIRQKVVEERIERLKIRFFTKSRFSLAVKAVPFFL